MPETRHDRALRTPTDIEWYFGRDFIIIPICPRNPSEGWREGGTKISELHTSRQDTCNCVRRGNENLTAFHRFNFNTREQNITRVLKIRNFYSREHVLVLLLFFYVRIFNSLIKKDNIVADRSIIFIQSDSTILDFRGSVPRLALRSQDREYHWRRLRSARRRRLNHSI